MADVGTWVTDGSNPKQWQWLPSNAAAKARVFAWVADPNGAGPAQWCSVEKGSYVTVVSPASQPKYWLAPVTDYFARTKRSAWITNAASAPPQYVNTQIEYSITYGFVTNASSPPPQYKLTHVDVP